MIQEAKDDKKKKMKVKIYDERQIERYSEKKRQIRKLRREKKIENGKRKKERKLMRGET